VNIPQQIDKEFGSHTNLVIQPKTKHYFGDSINFTFKVNKKQYHGKVLSKVLRPTHLEFRDLVLRVFKDSNITHRIHHDFGRNVYYKKIRNEYLCFTEHDGYVCCVNGQSSKIIIDNLLDTLSKLESIDFVKYGFTSKYYTSEVMISPMLMDQCVIDNGNGLLFNFSFTLIKKRFKYPVVFDLKYDYSFKMTDISDFCDEYGLDIKQFLTDLNDYSTIVSGDSDNNSFKYSSIQSYVDDHG